MEKKQNKLLLASAVFGAIFVLVIIISWIFTVREIGHREFNFFIPRNETSVLTLVALQLLMAIIIFSFVFNLIGRVNGSNRHILIAGILYALSLNLVPAFLCLRVYFKEERQIKNKLLLYTMICTSVFDALLIVLILAIAANGDKAGSPFYIYFISTISFGLILNFIAWKTGNSIAKIIAGIAYVLGLFTVISGVICVISSRDFLKAIKSKLLFYAMVFALIWMAVLIGSAFVGSEEDNVLLVRTYALPMAIAGLIINYFARKTNNKKAKIIAGIVYILGSVNLLSAILCFVSCKNNRKLPT